MAIQIYKGDDTNFADLRELSITIDTDLDLAGYTGEFDFLGNVKTFPTEQIATKTVQFAYTAEETASFIPGLSYGTFILFDPEGRRAAIQKVLIEVLTRFFCGGCKSQITITIDNVVDYDHLSNLPTIEGVTVQGAKTAHDYGIALLSDIDESGGVVKLSEDGFSMVPAGYLGETLTYRKLSFVYDPDMGEFVLFSSPERYVKSDDGTFTPITDESSDSSDDSESE